MHIWITTFSLLRIWKQLSNKWVSWHTYATLSGHGVMNKTLSDNTKLHTSSVGNSNLFYEVDWTKFLVKLNMWMLLSRLAESNKTWRQLMGPSLGNMYMMKSCTLLSDYSVSKSLHSNSWTNITTILIFHLNHLPQTPSLSYLVSIGRPQTLPAYILAPTALKEES